MNFLSMGAERVVSRFLIKTGKSPSFDTHLGFKYVPKETKKSKVNKLMRAILDHTGIARGVAEDIADAIIRNRDLVRLAIQKGWPVFEGLIEGPRGTFPLLQAENMAKYAKATYANQIKEPE